MPKIDLSTAWKSGDQIINSAICGSLIALSVITPSFKAGDLIKIVGIGSVVVGFAFQNILQNFLAGF